MRTERVTTNADATPRESGGLVQSVHRALDLLFMVAAANEPVIPARAAVELELPRSTIYRLADTLIERGVIARRHGGFVPTEKLFLLTSGGRATLRLRDAVEPHLERLVAETGETAGLHIPQANLRRCVLEIEGYRDVRWARGVGYTAPIWLGAVGHVLLAGLPPGEFQKRLLTFSFEPLASGSLVDAKQLSRKVEEARDQGWSESVSETVEGAAAIAAPVIRQDTVVGAINLYSPADRRAKLHEMVGSLIRTAQAASADWTSFAN